MKPRKALIADSAAEFREALAQALSSGFQVLCCGQGDDAMVLLESEKPDLLILDLALPGLEGISLLEQLPSRPPVLVVTDLISPYVQSSLIRLGVEYAMRKPCSVQTVADRALDLLNPRQVPAAVPLQEALIRLGFAWGKHGYRHLLTGIPLLAENRDQQLSKELYNAIAELDHSTAGAVEKSIREAIRDAWSRGDRTQWSRCFPGLPRCPRNKEFLFRMADLLLQTRRCG
jgi:CheY-like chemotaxis protein